MLKTHPSLTEIVPKSIRIKIYKKALKILENDPELTKRLGTGICLVLPCILWDLNHFLDVNPFGEDWNYREAKIAFPELAEFCRMPSEERNTKNRIIFLEKTIADLEKDTYKTDVIFRKYKDGDIIALFPHDIINSRGHVKSYMHVGQHSGADYMGVIMKTKPAKIDEFTDLKDELESIGYDLNIIIRINKRKYLDSLATLK